MRGAKPKDISGEIFGRLTVLRFLGSVNKRAVWECACACGNTVKVPGTALRSGNTASCGCIGREKTAKRNATHGFTRGEHRAMYAAWNTTKQRCTNPNNRDWRYYGGRGITLCERWHSFENFFADMGAKPQGYTLERIDNDKGYYPENCRWATRKEQANNQRRSLRITYREMTKTLAEWSELTGIRYHTLKARLQRLDYTDAACIEQPLAPQSKGRINAKRIDIDKL